MQNEVRPYRSETDYDAMLRLLERIYALEGPHVPFTVGDLAYWRAQETAPNPMGATQLWFAAGEPVGFVWPETGFYDLAVHPRHRSLLPVMLDWADDDQRLRAATEVRTRALESDDEFTALLRGRGFAPAGETYSWYGVRSLADAPPAPAVAAGYTIRAAADADALEALHATVRAGPPIHSYRALRTSPIYRADLDLAAFAPDGAPVAFTLVWFDASNRAGLFEPVGCHADHRRRGLATALIHQGLRRLRDLGATHALIGNNEANAGANRLYRSLGFEVRDRNVTWLKTLASA